MRILHRALVCVVVLLVCTVAAYGQSVRELKPMLGIKRSFTKEQCTYWQKVSNQEIELEGEAAERYWNGVEGPLIPGSGGEQLDKECLTPDAENGVTASSQLPKSGQTTYLGSNAFDSNLFTAWAPNTGKQTVGAKLNVSFSDAPRITAIHIWNGYQKWDALWKANARVEKLRLYVDGKPYALLRLQDTRTEQIFTIAPAIATKGSAPLRLTFEIVSVYPGSKYQDVLISEIRFDGECPGWEEE